MRMPVPVPPAPHARSRRRWLLLLPLPILGAAAAPARAQSPGFLVRDTTTVATAIGSEPRRAVRVGSGAFFVASTPQTGTELWKTDGTAQGTALVKDIAPGPDPPGPLFFDIGPRSLVDVNGTLFFAASDQTRGFELWRSDGTEAGTLRVKDIRPGPDASNASTLVAVNGTLFFSADDGVAGRELWKSDGTEQGTRRVKDIAPGPESSFPDELREIDGSLVLRACDDHGCETWTSDGSAAGTRRLADVEPGPVGSNPLAYTPSGALVYFAAQTEATGYELWAFPRSALFDADGDGVTDASDDCPATANPDQADLDGDGEGDACDADDDGDGIADAADLCQDSPPDERVSAEGCAAEELIALRCPREEFTRHGRYVSCLAHAAQEAVRDGLMPPSGKTRFVKRGAHGR